MLMITLYAEQKKLRFFKRIITWTFLKKVKVNDHVHSKRTNSIVIQGWQFCWFI